MNPPVIGRRLFLGGALAAGTGILTGADEKKPAVVEPARNPLIYHFKIGELDAWSISDGSVLMRESLNLMWPEDARPEMKEWLEARGERTDGIPLYVNILVVRIGKEIALFDAGFEPSGNSNLGWTAAALGTIGIRHEDVTAGFLSHAHIDHLGGFVRGDKPAFPNAALHYLPEEFEFWHADEPDFSKSKRNPKEIPGMIRDVRSRFEILKPICQPVKSGTKFFNGAITIEAAPGHTAGHAMFRIESAGETLLHLMDLSHHHGFMFHNPEWTIGFDHDPKQSVATRKTVFARAAAERTRCYGFHVPWPGLGHLVPVGPGYLWHPERWSWGT